MRKQTEQAGTVYIVDDDTAVTESLSVLAEILEISKQTYSSAIEFLSFVESHDISERSCLIVDLRMPQMDGIEMLEKMREDKKRIPTIMITGHGTTELKLRAEALGVVAFLEKPFRTEQLEQILREQFKMS